MKDETLYLALPSGQNYGWGICGIYLQKEISKRRVKTFFIKKGENFTLNLPGNLFTAITNIDFNSFTSVRGKKNYGYTFFENELNQQSVKNSENYDLIFCGSNWCRNKLEEKGITNSGLLIQGIDPEMFYPITDEKDSENFVIFSGGKFELRKGQDLVLRAFKILQEKYQDIVLINSWYNNWLENMKTMYLSNYINFSLSDKIWKDYMKELYYLNGLDTSRIFTYREIPYKKQRQIYAKTDIALFPNRCEGGTNLVMMEYMACGKPVIASFTSGHQDILTPENSIMLTDLKELRFYDDDKNIISDWQEPSLEELVDKIEFAYNHRSEIKNIGKRAGEHLKKFTWGQSSEQLLAAIY